MVTCSGRGYDREKTTEESCEMHTSCESEYIGLGVHFVQSFLLKIFFVKIQIGMSTNETPGKQESITLFINLWH